MSCKGKCTKNKGRLQVGGQSTESQQSRCSICNSLNSLWLTYVCNKKSWSIVALMYLHHYLVPVYHLECWNTVEAQPKSRPHRHHLIYKCSLMQQRLLISQYSECEFHSQLSPGIEECLLLSINTSYIALCPIQNYKLAVLPPHLAPSCRCWADGQRFPPSVQTRHWRADCQQPDVRGRGCSGDGPDCHTHPPGCSSHTQCL